MPALPPLIHDKSRMRRRGCTDLCGGRSAMVVPTATLNLAAGSAVRIASIKNAAGEFVKPSAKSITAAATASGSKMSNDFCVSLTNASGKESYPISSFTWFYVPAIANDPGRGSAVASYLKWVYTSGQKIAQDRGYAILPPEVLEKVAARATTVR